MFKSLNLAQKTANRDTQRRESKIERGVPAGFCAGFDRVEMILAANYYPLLCTFIISTLMTFYLSQPIKDQRFRVSFFSTLASSILHFFLTTKSKNNVWFIPTTPTILTVPFSFSPTMLQTLWCTSNIHLPCNVKPILGIHTKIGVVQFI